MAEDKVNKFISPFTNTGNEAISDDNYDSNFPIPGVDMFNDSLDEGDFDPPVKGLPEENAASLPSETAAGSDFRSKINPAEDPAANLDDSLNCGDMDETQLPQGDDDTQLQQDDNETQLPFELDADFAKHGPSRNSPNADVTNLDNDSLCCEDMDDTQLPQSVDLEPEVDSRSAPNEPNASSPVSYEPIEQSNSQPKVPKHTLSDPTNVISDTQFKETQVKSVGKEANDEKSEEITSSSGQDTASEKKKPSFGKKKSFAVPLQATNLKITSPSSNVSTDTEKSIPKITSPTLTPQKENTTNVEQPKMDEVKPVEKVGLKKPKFSVAKSATANGKCKGQGPMSGSNNTDTGNDKENQTPVKKTSGKKTESESKKLEREQKKIEKAQKMKEKEQKLLEKEKKKADKERQKEEKMLEMERKKAEREKEKMEKELAKMERELNKKVKKQASVSKTKAKQNPKVSNTVTSKEDKDTSSSQDTKEQACENMDGNSDNKQLDLQAEHAINEPAEAKEKSTEGVIEKGKESNDTAIDTNDLLIDEKETDAPSKLSKTPEEDTTTLPEAACNSTENDTCSDKTNPDSKEQKNTPIPSTPSDGEISKADTSAKSSKFKQKKEQGAKAAKRKIDTDTQHKPAGQDKEILPATTHDSTENSSEEDKCTDETNSDSKEQKNIPAPSTSSDGKISKTGSSAKSSKFNPPKKTVTQKGQGGKAAKKRKLDTSTDTPKHKKKSNENKKKKIKQSVTVESKKNTPAKTRKRKANFLSDDSDSDSDLSSQPGAKKPANFSGPVWVQCENIGCQKWRKLTDCHDPTKVPEEWKCSMSNDPECNRCSAPEEQWSDIGDSQEFVETPFIPGSIIWAKMDGYPWWPAMIEEEPDENTYYEMGNRGSLIPVKYHVVFFDTPVCRGWVHAIHIQSFTERSNANEQHCCTVAQKYKQSLRAGMKQAKGALNQSTEERLELFGFSKRFRQGSGGRKKKCFIEKGTADDCTFKGKRNNDTGSFKSSSRKSTRLETNQDDKANREQTASQQEPSTVATMSPEAEMRESSPKAMELLEQKDTNQESHQFPTDDLDGEIGSADVIPSAVPSISKQAGVSEMQSGTTVLQQVEE